MSNFFIQPLDDDGRTAPCRGYDRIINAPSLILALEDFMDEADFSEAEFRVKDMNSNSVIYVEAMQTPDGYAFRHYPGKFAEISTKDKVNYLQHEAIRLNEIREGTNESDTAITIAIVSDLIKTLYGVDLTE